MVLTEQQILEEWKEFSKNQTKYELSVLRQGLNAKELDEDEEKASIIVSKPWAALHSPENQKLSVEYIYPNKSTQIDLYPGYVVGVVADLLGDSKYHINVGGIAVSSETNIVSNEPTLLNENTYIFETSEVIRTLKSLQIVFTGQYIPKVLKVIRAVF
jgi:hypothetical protein